MYHVKTTTAITFFDRVLHAKTFYWDSDGRPVFGTPAAITRPTPLGDVKPGSACPPALQDRSIRQQRGALVVCTTAVATVLVLVLAVSVAGSREAHQLMRATTHAVLRLTPSFHHDV